jgi:hypothetical protein
MQTFTLNYHKNSMLLLSMLCIPILYSGLTLAILLKLQPSIADWLIFVIIASSLLMMILLLRWVIYSQIMVQSKVSINDKGISFKLQKNSFLYRYVDFYSGWENVNNISEIFCSRTGNYFYRITFKNPFFSANFSAIKNGEAEAEKFFSELDYYKETYGLFLPKSKIKSKAAHNTWAGMS